MKRLIEPRIGRCNLCQARMYGFAAYLPEFVAGARFTERRKFLGQLRAVFRHEKVLNHDMPEGPGRLKLSAQ